MRGVLQNITLNMAATLPQKIKLLEREIAELEESLAIEKNPPPVKVDESAYAALAAVRQTLAEAKSAQERKELIQEIERSLAQQKTELADLKAALAAKQNRIADLQQQQQQALDAYHNLERHLIEQAKSVIGLAESIAAESTDVIGTVEPVKFVVRSTEVNRIMDLQVDEAGSVLLSHKDSGLIHFNRDFGGMTPTIPNYQHQTAVLEPA